MNKFRGFLDFPDFEDQVHHLEVIELLLRDNEIAFSMKWAYGAGNADAWFFEGVAKKNGLNYVTQNVIGKKYQDSLGDDDGNDIFFKKVLFDHEFGDLELEGTIKYKAESFDFEGLLEQSDIVSTPISDKIQDRRKKRSIDATLVRGPRRRNGLFFITAEVERLPTYFQSYITENRIFLAESKKYEEVLNELNLAENVLSWIRECKKLISHFEKNVHRTLNQLDKLHIFDDEKRDFANQLMEILDMEPDTDFLDLDMMDKEQAEFFRDTQTYFQDIYSKLRSIGYEVYYSWIDAK